MSIRDGLLAEYLFHGDAADSSGHRHSAQVVGAALTKDRFGHENSAYSFNGKDQFIVVDNAPVMAEGAFSLSVWAKYGRTASLRDWSNAIVSQDCGGKEDRRVFQLSTFQKKTTWHRFYDKDPEVEVDEPLYNERWYHFTAVFDGEKHRLYRDGVLMDEKRGTWAPKAGEPLYIGSKSKEKSFFFNGVIDDIRIYDRALTEDDILELVTEGGWMKKERVIAARHARSNYELVQVMHKREPNQKLKVENSNISYSSFVNVFGEHVKWFDVSVQGMLIENADLRMLQLEDFNLTEARIANSDLSDLEIDGAQLGGAYIHHIGVPAKGHLMYREGQEQRPLRFEECDLHGSVIRSCDLSGVSLEQCRLTGMTIDGVPVEDLLRVYKETAGTKE